MARPRLHDDALRTRLLEVASAVISVDGPSALTVRDVARRAGTSASAVYALFGSRDALVVGVGVEATARFAAHLAGPAPTHDPGADLLALGLAYRASALADPHFYRVMFDVRPSRVAGERGAREPERDPGAVSSGPAATDAPTFLLLRDAVARILLAGGTPADRAGTAAVEPALQLWGLVHGLVMLELAGLLPGTADERTDRYTAALRHAGPGLVGADRA